MIRYNNRVITFARDKLVSFRGLRMTADEFLALGETSERLELIDGVVCMSPSASLPHQRIISEISFQIGAFLRSAPIGVVAVEVDVRLSDRLVYRPDLIYLSSEKAVRCGDRVTEIPDVVVEVISPDSSRLDRETKKRDYERAGVQEYWIIDPLESMFEFYWLENGRFAAVPAIPDSFESRAIPGFALALPPIRAIT